MGVRTGPELLTQGPSGGVERGVAAARTDDRTSTAAVPDTEDSPGVFTSGVQVAGIRGDVGARLRDGVDVRGGWEAATEWPLTAAAVLFLAAYAWPILKPDLSDQWVTVCRAVTWTTWALFVVDYAARLVLSRRRWRFVRANLFELAVVALPLLRPLRLLRLVALLSVLNRHVGGSLRGRVAVYVTGATALVLFVASLAVLQAERRAPQASIRTFGDALWWAMTTVTTVGYGDRYPVTLSGRIVAAGLMLAGIALLGIVTASLASWLLDRVREIEAETHAATRQDVEMLTQEVRQLREELMSVRALGEELRHTRPNAIEPPLAPR